VVCAAEVRPLLLLLLLSRLSLMRNRCKVRGSSGRGESLPVSAGSPGSAAFAGSRRAYRILVAVRLGCVGPVETRRVSHSLWVEVTAPLHRPECPGTGTGTRFNVSNQSQNQSLIPASSISTRAKPKLGASTRNGLGRKGLWLHPLTRAHRLREWRSPQQFFGVLEKLRVLRQQPTAASGPLSR
jgi:hypothetical protein